MSRKIQERMHLVSEEEPSWLKPTYRRRKRARIRIHTGKRGNNGKARLRSICDRAPGSAKKGTSISRLKFLKKEAAYGEAGAGWSVNYKDFLTRGPAPTITEGDWGISKSDLNDGPAESEGEGDRKSRAGGKRPFSGAVGSAGAGFSKGGGPMRAVFFY